MTRLIDADELIKKANFQPLAPYILKRDVDDAPTVDAIPIDWLTERINETARPKDDNDIELNHALFWTGVEWERWKKEHG